MSAVKASLHRAWLRQLRREWHRVNDERLDGKLRPPVFRLDDAVQRLGSWSQSHRTLTVSARHITEVPWRDVVDTLRHEMAHQVADELLGGHERPHGEVFARACHMLGITPAGSALGSSEASPEDLALERVLNRVHKLLALAESDNPHEAQAALAQAHRQLLAVHLRPDQVQRSHHYIHAVVGRSAAALPLLWKLVSSILEEFFFVQCVWVTTYNPRKDRLERELELSGRPSDVSMATWVHDFLHAEVERLWRRRRLEAGQRGQRGRREYQCGVMLGFRDKLRHERRQCEEGGLVWTGDPELVRYVKAKHPDLKLLGGAGLRRSDAMNKGRRDGARLQMRRPVERAASQLGALIGPSDRSS